MFHHLGGIFLLAILDHHEMQDLVDQAHGIELAGAYGLFRMVEQVTLLVHLLGEGTGGVEIGKDDVAIRGI